jgi:thiol-disulfide isomerase/thioredoxin
MSQWAREVTPLHAWSVILPVAHRTARKSPSVNGGRAMPANLIVAICISVAFAHEAAAMQEVIAPPAPIQSAELLPGDAAPALSVNSLLQAPHATAATWEALRGQVVVLEFWATWCGPCINIGIPHLNELAETLADRPVRFIAITDEAPDRVEPFLQRKPIRGWIALDPDRTTFDAYGVRGIPRTFIVDGQGRLVFSGHPTEVSIELLEQIIGGDSESIIDSTRANMERQRSADRELAEADLIDPSYQLTVRKLSAAPHHYRTSRGGGGKVRTYASFGPGLRALLADLWSLSPDRIDIPAAIDSVALKVDAEIPTRAGMPDNELRAMVASRIEEAVAAALEVSIRREARPTKVLVLRPRPGWEQKLRPSDAAPSMSAMPGQVSGQGMPLASLCQALQQHIGCTVLLDAPGSAFPCDFDIEWNPQDPASFVAAVENQLGFSAAEESRTLEHLIIEFIPDAGE